MTSSDRYSDSSDGYSGSEEGSPSSEDYSGSSEDYSSSDGEPTSSEGESPPQPPVPWWAKAGFDSLQAALAHQDAINDRWYGVTRPRELPEPEEWLPGEAVEGSPSRRDPRETRQVNVRLRAVDHARLVALAADYDVVPAVMARMLLRRGIQAAGGED